MMLRALYSWLSNGLGFALILFGFNGPLPGLIGSANGEQKDDGVRDCNLNDFEKALSVLTQMINEADTEDKVLKAENQLRLTKNIKGRVNHNPPFELSVFSKLKNQLLQLETKLGEKRYKMNISNYY